MPDHAAIRAARNLIVTGLPRAGTTLTAALLDGLADTVCINEPKWQSRWSREGGSRADYVERIVSDFARVRETLLDGGTLAARVRADGGPLTNYFDAARNRLPVGLATLSRASLPPDFLLAMKHNAHYACVLPDLAAQGDVAVLAIIRDPVATLASWRSLDLPVSKGRMPAAEPYWPELRGIIQSTDDLLVRQARMLELLFARFDALKQRIAIVKLEDVIADPLTFARLLGRAQKTEVPITPSRIASSLSNDERAQIETAVASHCPTALRYYPSAPLNRRHPDESQDPAILMQAAGR